MPSYSALTWTQREDGGKKKQRRLQVCGPATRRCTLGGNQISETDSVGDEWKRKKKGRGASEQQSEAVSCRLQFVNEGAERVERKEEG